MKIRVQITSPVVPMKGHTVWNIFTIDEFADKFIRGDSIVIGDYTAPIYNFEKHNKYTATFNTIDHIRFTYADITLAMMGIDAPEEHRGAFHNIELNIIDDDQNPLANPAANESPKSSHVLHTYFSGKSEQLKQSDVFQKKKLLNSIEALIHAEEQKLRKQTDDNTRKHIGKVILGLINKHKDNYADLKRELSDAGVESAAAHFLYEDYYADKYGGTK